MGAGFSARLIQPGNTSIAFTWSNAQGGISILSLYQSSATSSPIFEITFEGLSDGQITLTKFDASGTAISTVKLASLSANTPTDPLIYLDICGTSLRMYQDMQTAQTGSGSGSGSAVREGFSVSFVDDAVATVGLVSGSTNEQGNLTFVSQGTSQVTTCWLESLQHSNASSSVSSTDVTTHSFPTYSIVLLSLISATILLSLVMIGTSVAAKKVPVMNREAIV